MATASARELTTLEVVQNAAGDAPPDCTAGAKPGRVWQMSGRHINPILQFYQLHTEGHIDDR